VLNKRIHFKTRDNRNALILEINDWNYSCSESVEIIPIQDLEKTGQVEYMTRNEYYQYKKKLIFWFKTQIDGFPPITDEIIGWEVDNIYTRECNGENSDRKDGLIK